MSLIAYSALAGLFTAVLVVFLVRFLGARMPASVDAYCAERDEIALLFRGDHLVDAHNDLWPILGKQDIGRLDWATVREVLHPLLPGFPETPPTATGPATYVSGPKITSTVTDDIIRVTLEPTTEMQKEWLALRQKALDLASLEPVLKHSPNPIWCVSHEGQFLWANDAFDQLAQARSDAQSLTQKITKDLEDATSNSCKRIALSWRDNGQKRWFEVSAQDADIGMLYFATDIDAVVRAENAQRNFVQTLSKTFANLTTGLAIFDRNRRLALFNPALIDLSGLSAEFLSGRPNLFEFFDKLRDQRIMPEPKCYDNWRERMGRLVAAASDDRFRETWNLPSGQTFDVTGKPYPDGAVAFLFNDITAEVSLTRGFRNELEIMQSSLDAMEDAIAIFNSQGVLTVCNDAYKSMWSVDPDTSVVETTILDATQEWKSAFHPSPVWPEVRDFVTNTLERASWDSDLRSKDGRKMTCRIDPICFGATMIRFSHASSRDDSAIEGEPLQIASG